MARRVRWIESYRFSDAAAVQIPALVVTGEDHLDRIVAPELTRQYLERLAAGALARLARRATSGR